MRLCLLLLIFVTSQGPTPTPSEVGKPPQQQSTSTQQPASTDQRGTYQTPLVVKISPSPKTDKETKQDEQDRAEKATSDWWNVRLTGGLALIGLLQLLVYGYQSLKLRETVKSAGEQSAAMERHIGEAARSADAMEDIAKKIEAGNKAVLRAYLTVTVGGAVFQQRESDRQTQGDVKFEGKPTITNTGATAARNVLIRSTARILPTPIPDDFDYPLPVAPTAAGIVGPHHQYVMSAVVKETVPDNEVGDIKQGKGRALCMWGEVTYDDIFGDRHTTKFGQILTFIPPDNRVFGYYIGAHSDSD